MRRLGDGSLLSETDRRVNAIVDELARSAAARDRLSSSVREWVCHQWERVSAIACWIGQATALAGDFPAPGIGQGCKLRDSEGQRSRAVAATTGRGSKRVAAPQMAPACDRVAGDLSSCERWEALRQRIAAKEAARKDDVGERP